MNLDAIRHFLNAEPFEPIELRLANGDRHHIKNPDNMAVGKNVVVVTYDDSNRIAWCPPHQVISIEKLASPAGNEN